MISQNNHNKKEDADRSKRETVKLFLGAPADVAFGKKTTGVKIAAIPVILSQGRFLLAVLIFPLAISCFPQPTCVCSFLLHKSDLMYH